MDLQKIKHLVKQNGDKFIFVENGEPEMVMMSFQEYEKLNGLSLQKKHQVRLGSSSKDGSEFADFGLEEVPETEFMISQGGGMAGLPVRTEDIRLEDLPI